MARKIVFTSGKGGVGKTTMCFLVGKELAKMGSKVAIFDVDIGLNNLDVVSGVENKVVFDIVDVAKNKCRPEQALIRVDGMFNFFVLPSAHPANVGKVDLNGIKNVVAKLETRFDYVLIDCPAGIDFGFLRAVFCASEAVIVSTPHISALRDASKVAEILCSLKIENISLVVNRNIKHLVQAKKQLCALDISKTLNLNLLGVVEENSQILVASSMFGSLNGLQSSCFPDIKTIAKNLANGQFSCKIESAFA